MLNGTVGIVEITGRAMLLRPGGVGAEKATGEGKLIGSQGVGEEWPCESERSIAFPRCESRQVLICKNRWICLEK
jgi:hypothetical protein